MLYELAVRLIDMVDPSKYPEHSIIARLGNYKTWLLQRIGGVDFSKLSIEEKRKLRDDVRNYVYNQHSTCEHTNVKVVYFFASNGSKRFTKQCGDCYFVFQKTLSGNLSPAERERATLRVEVDYNYVTQLRREIYDEMMNEIQILESGTWWDLYDQYLQTPEWQEKRVLVLNRANYACEGCGKARATQVHHLTYERLGREMLFDLVAVCDDCHKKIHDRHTT